MTHKNTVFEPAHNKRKQCKKQTVCSLRNYLDDTQNDTQNFRSTDHFFLIYQKRNLIHSAKDFRDINAVAIKQCNLRDSISIACSLKSYLLTTKSPIL